MTEADINMAANIQARSSQLPDDPLFPNWEWTRWEYLMSPDRTNECTIERDGQATGFRRDDAALRRIIVSHSGFYELLAIKGDKKLVGFTGESLNLYRLLRGYAKDGSHEKMRNHINKALGDKFQYSIQFRYTTNTEGDTENEPLRTYKYPWRMTYPANEQ